MHCLVKAVHINRNGCTAGRLNIKLWCHSSMHDYYLCGIFKTIYGLATSQALWPQKATGADIDHSHIRGKNKHCIILGVYVIVVFFLYRVKQCMLDF